VVSVDAITIEPPPEGVVVDPSSWFDAPGPFEVEIGCGKGGFLLSRARAFPVIRFLGIEWANKFYRYAADRMARWQVSNVRLMRTDAGVFVTRHLPPECVSVLHLYHPDPWPKKRHHKRRLVQPHFAEAAIRCLVSGGRWMIQSDHEEYFHWIRSVLDGHTDLREIDWDEADASAGPDWKGTNFEVKYTREGRRIHRVAYEKSSK
jgi:tRNA (guanine-N7-)-methyltransferase